MKAIAGLPAHADRDHRVAMMRVLRDLIGDHGEQPPVLTRRRELQHPIAVLLEHAEHVR